MPGQRSGFLSRYKVGYDALMSIEPHGHELHVPKPGEHSDSYKMSDHGVLQTLIMVTTLEAVVAIHEMRLMTETFWYLIFAELSCWSHQRYSAIRDETGLRISSQCPLCSDLSAAQLPSGFCTANLVPNRRSGLACIVLQSLVRAWHRCSSSHISIACRADIYALLIATFWESEIRCFRWYVASGRRLGLAKVVATQLVVYYCARREERWISSTS